MNARPERKSHVVADALKLWGGTIVEQVFAFIRGIVVPRHLGPDLYGVLGGMGLILKYGAYLQLGLTTAAGREIPHAIAADDDERARRIARAAYSFGLLSSLVPALVLAGVAGATWGHWRPEVSWGLAAFAALLVTDRLELLFETLFQARRRFGASFAFTAVKAAVRFGLVVGLLFVYGLYGVYVGLVAAGVLFAFVGSAWTRTWAGPWPTWRVIRELLPVGLPLVGIGALGFLLQSVDRLLVIRFLPGPPLGHYMLAATIVTFIYFLPLNVGQAMAPRIYALPREAAARGAFEEYLVKPSLVVTYVVAAVGGLAILCLKPFIHFVMPAYKPSVPVVAALLVGVTCQGGAQGAGFILIAWGRFRAIALAQAAALAAAVAVIAVALYAGWGIVGVAAGASAGLVVYACILQVLAWRALPAPGRGLVYAFAYLLGPPAIVAAILAAAFYVPAATVSLWGGALTLAAVGFVLLAVRLIVYVPLIVFAGWLVERQTGFLAFALNALKERLSSATR